MKSLYDISWKVTEAEYRADPALSYSTLARYEREGFNNLNKLFDKVESPSLTFGSAVDILITGNDEEFDNTFMVAELENPLSDSLIAITKRLFDTFKSTYSLIIDIPDNELLDTIEDIQWNNHWLPKTRAKKIKEDCKGYYSLLYLAEGRTILSTKLYNDISKTVDALKGSLATQFYFQQNNLWDNNVERFYQLKFKETFEGIDYRCMADLLLVIHDKNLIIPVDLKTSSKAEWDFYKSFVDWRYDIQSRLYWRIIRANMDKDDYFKSFTLAPYRFIVANRNTLTPLVWEFKSTIKNGDITLGSNNQILLRDPFTIGKELNHYLIDKPIIPDGITNVKYNNLEEWINKL